MFAARPSCSLSCNTAAVHCAEPARRRQNAGRQTCHRCCSLAAYRDERRLDIESKCIMHVEYATTQHVMTDE